MSPTHRPGTPGSTLDDRPLFTESAVKHVLPANPVGASPTRHVTQRKAADGQQTTLVRVGKAASRRWTTVMTNHLAYQR
jgi:hypothetical protein